MESRRVLLVSSGTTTEVENCLYHAGCHVTKVNRGSAAVNRARHEMLDMAVLISTEPEMDLVETALNLRDINPSLTIVFLADFQSSHEDADQTDAIAHAIPRAKVLTTSELERYLYSAE